MAALRLYGTSIVLLSWALVVVAGINGAFLTAVGLSAVAASVVVAERERNRRRRS